MNHYNIRKITGLTLSIVSPQQILDWATRIILNTMFIGNIITSDLIDYTTGLPKEKGLFCQRIFGPLVSWKCKCTENTFYKLNRICNNCGLELISSIVRKYRMGCIKLNTFLFNPWFYKINSIIPTLLNINNNFFINLIYYKNCTFYNIDNNIFNNNLLFNIISFKQITLIQQLFINDLILHYFKYLNLITQYNKEREYLFLNKELNNIYLRLSLFTKFYINKIKLNWLLLENLPVLPAELRPFTKLSESNFIISIINNLYVFIIIHNNRLYKYNILNTKFSLFFNIIEKSILQKSLETLMLEKSKKKISLTNNLIGKYGRFRYFLLGKRLDFSGRSVITAGPDLNFSKIGIPIGIALALYKPLLKSILSSNIFLQNILYITTIKYNNIIIQRIISRLFKHNMIIINRAPTLHKLNIQSFKPYLIEGNSIKLYPLSCTGFNADFDGDQMSIILTLTKYARKESKINISSDKNIITSVYNNIVYKLNQAMLLGGFNLKTIIGKTFKYKVLYFNTLYESLYYLNQNLLTLDTKLKYRYYNIYLYLTLGRVLLNNYLHTTV